MPDKSYPEGVTSMDHVNHDMKMGRFPNVSSVETFLKERATLAAQDEVAHLPSDPPERDDDPSASLSELSAKATPGPWHVDMFPYRDMETGEPQPPQCEGICTHDDEGGLANSIATCNEREAKFIVALVNAYRSGKLKEVDPA